MNQVPLECVRFYSLRLSDDVEKRTKDTRVDIGDTTTRLSLVKEITQILTHTYYTQLDPTDRDDVRQTIFSSLSAASIRNSVKTASLWDLMQLEHLRHTKDRPKRRAPPLRRDGSDSDDDHDRDSAKISSASRSTATSSDESSEDQELAQIYGVGYRKRGKKHRGHASSHEIDDGEGMDSATQEARNRRAQLEFLFEEDYQQHFHQVPSFAHAVLGSWVSKEYARIGYILSYRPHILKHFFRSDRESCRSFFDPKFLVSKSHGAYALQNYSLSHRDTIWEKLVWTNRIVSPVVAVQNLHRFFELNIDATMDNLLENERDFWRSSDFRRCIEDGTYIPLNPNYWIRVLYHELLEGDSEFQEELEGALFSFLRREPFDVIVNSCLPYLDNDLVLKFLRAIYRSIHFDGQENKAKLDLIFKETKWTSIPELCIMHLALVYPFRLNRFLCEESDAARNAHDILTKFIRDRDILSLTENHGRKSTQIFWQIISRFKRNAFRPVDGVSFCEFLSVEAFLLQHILTQYYADVNKLYILLKENNIVCQEIHGSGEDGIVSYTGPDSTLVDIYGGLSDDSDEERVKRGRKRRHKGTERKKASKQKAVQTPSCGKIFVGWTFEGDKTHTTYSPNYVAEFLSNQFTHKFTEFYKRSTS